MFERIHQKLGTAGFVISIIALVAALGGGAYAASSNGGKATASAKAKQGKQGKQGKPGKTGPAGPAGPQGPAGAPGAKGDTGAAGTNGTNGTNGAPGASVTNTAVPTSSATCNHQGGAEFKVGSGAATTACNGQTGFTATLPPGQTETGTWTATASLPEFGSLPFPISYNIPLAEPSEHVKFLSPAETASSEGSGECELVGTGFSATPVAPPGYLCVFARVVETGTFLFIGPNGFEVEHDTPVGASIWVELTESAPQDLRASMSGVWAVTASE